MNFKGIIERECTKKKLKKLDKAVCRNCRNNTAYKKAFVALVEQVLYRKRKGE